MKLSVHLVTWNGEKYIPYLFASLRKQTFSDWELFVWENNSSDKTLELIAKELDCVEDLKPYNDEEVEDGRALFLEGKSGFSWRMNISEDNKGFAGGHNEAFLRTKSEYILLLNQDMVLEPDCLEKLVKFMDENKDVATISPRLMRWDFENQKFTDKIDSFGLKVFKNRKVIELYTGQEWTELQQSLATDQSSLEVFGVSGALPMFRRSALENVMFEGMKIFDESYGSYKEDVDLAFRLRSAGHKAFVLPDAVAYHDRSAEGLKDKSDKAAVKNKKKQSDWVRYHSYKNHLMTIYKNEYWQNFLLDFFPIKWYEIKKFTWFLMFDRKVLKGLGEIWKNRKELRGKKEEIRSKRKIDWREMRLWFK